jgi:hypothetical protein
MALFRIAYGGHSSSWSSLVWTSAQVQREGGPRPGMITMSFLKGGKPGISARRIIVSCEYKLIIKTIG